MCAIGWKHKAYGNQIRSTKPSFELHSALNGISAKNRSFIVLFLPGKLSSLLRCGGAHGIHCALTTVKTSGWTGRLCKDRELLLWHRLRGFGNREEQFTHSQYLISKCAHALSSKVEGRTFSLATLFLRLCSYEESRWPRGYFLMYHSVVACMSEAVPRQIPVASARSIGDAGGPDPLSCNKLWVTGLKPRPLKTGFCWFARSGSLWHGFVLQVPVVCLYIWQTCFHFTSIQTSLRTGLVFTIVFAHFFWTPDQHQQQSLCFLEVIWAI